MHKQFFHNPMYYMDDLAGDRGRTFLLRVVIGVMSVRQRTAVPCKMEKTGGQRRYLAKWRFNRHTGCSLAIEGPCGGRAWWQWSASTVEETGGQSRWLKGEDRWLWAPAGVRGEGMQWPKSGGGAQDRRWQSSGVGGRCGGGRWGGRCGGGWRPKPTRMAQDRWLVWRGQRRWRAGGRGG
jgi:hypothetical protein